MLLFPGRGWLSLTIKSIYAYYIPSKNEECDSLSGKLCDVYVKVFADGNEILTTERTDNTNFLHLNRVLKPEDFSKQPISKATKIKIQVWDQNTLFSDELVQETDGDIDSYLNKPLRTQNGNFIETSTIWFDELTD